MSKNDMPQRGGIKEDFYKKKMLERGGIVVSKNEKL